MRKAQLTWAIVAALAVIALAWQVLYEVDIRNCQRFGDMTYLPILCAGPLDGWVLPATLVVAVMLVAIGIWRLVPPPRY